jgi:DNA primase
VIDTSGTDVYGAFSKHLNMGKKQATTHGGEYWTHCPFCGTGNDRFHVWPYRFDGGPQYWCRVCGKFGDVINFIEHTENMSFPEACQLLNIELEHATVNSPRSIYSANDDVAPSDKWQDKAAKFCLECKKTLWSEQGKSALTWLRNRGLSDETINLVGLGYHHQSDRFDEKSDWDVTDPDKKSVWIPQGIVTPWHIDRQLWKVNIRRPDYQDGRGKYIPIAGGSKGIYGIDSFNPELPSVLVEGEFDKLILAQYEPGCINALATGSASHAQGERWALILAQSQVVLIAFDTDEGGQEAARDYWLKSIPHAVLWQPWAHDINDMHLQGIDVHEWLFCGLEMAEALSVIPDRRISDDLSVSIPVVPIVNLDMLLDQRVIPHIPQSSPVADEPIPLRIYIPSYLPALPRTQCPFSPDIEIKGSLKRSICTRKPLANGWCEEHGYVQEFLDLGAHLEYPRVHLRDGLFLAAGIASWEGRATTATAKSIAKDLTVIRSLFGRPLTI